MSSKLRTRFTDHLTVLRKAPKTKEAYLRAVSGLAGYYRCPPDRLTNEQIQEYLRHLIEERKLSWSSCNVVLSGLVCFYRGFLKWNETRLTIPPRPRIRQLPMILTVDEVRTLINSPTSLKHHALLKTVYCAGLRVSEVVNLKPRHIESDPSRMLIRVEQGKGQKDRYTVLTSDCLETLRAYWRAFHPGQWLFPGAKPGRPMSISAAQRIYEAAKKKPA
jgi:site-specific recombinase XerD